MLISAHCLFTECGHSSLIGRVLVCARLYRYLEHFVKNLGYMYPDGRLAVLDMIHAIVTKFPEAELNKQVCCVL